RRRGTRRRGCWPCTSPNPDCPRTSGRRGASARRAPGREPPGRQQGRPGRAGRSGASRSSPFCRRAVTAARAAAVVSTTTPCPHPAPEPTVPSSLLDKRETRIRRMFGAIAPRYDLLNHLLSLNVDRWWRWRTTRLVPPGPDGPILDVCTGTGDLALAYDRAAGGRVPIVGSDFCLPMLLPAAKKTARARAAGRIRFIEADTQRLPFPDDTFQLTAVAFGLRNVTDPERGLAEMVRVTR